MIIIFAFITCDCASRGPHMHTPLLCVFPQALGRWLTVLITSITIDDANSMHSSGFESRNISLYAIYYYMQSLLWESVLYFLNVMLRSVIMMISGYIPPGDSISVYCKATAFRVHLARPAALQQCSKLHVHVRGTLFSMALYSAWTETQTYKSYFACPIHVVTSSPAIVQVCTNRCRYYQYNIFILYYTTSWLD